MYVRVPVFLYAVFKCCVRIRRALANRTLKNPSVTHLERKDYRLFNIVLVINHQLNYRTLFEIIFRCDQEKFQRENVVKEIPPGGSNLGPSPFESFLPRVTLESIVSPFSSDALGQ